MATDNMKCNRSIEMVRECVKQFLREITINTLEKGELEVSAPYAIYHEDFTAKPSWPNSDNPGVYLFLDTADDDILYVGKSEGAMGNRIWSHFGRLVDDAPIKERHPNAARWMMAKAPHVAFITIRLNVRHSWLAPALESFMIENLRNQGFDLIGNKIK